MEKEKYHLLKRMLSFEQKLALLIVGFDAANVLAL